MYLMIAFLQANTRSTCASWLWDHLSEPDLHLHSTLQHIYAACFRLHDSRLVAFTLQLSLKMLGESQVTYLTASLFTAQHARAC